MKVIGTVTRGLYRDVFHNWVVTVRQLPLMRLYLGNKSRHYNLFLMIRAWDEGTTTLDFTRSLIAEIRDNLIAANVVMPPGGAPGQPIDRESVYGVYREENEFKMINYLDRIGVRTHLILRGEGEYRNEDSSVTYQKGDIVLLDQDDFGKVTQHDATKGTLHLVTCWSNRTHPRNWQLFADSMEKKTAWPGLGGHTFFMKDEQEQKKLLEKQGVKGDFE